jgi:hypothetical protein
MIMSYHHLVISCSYLILERNHSTVTDVLALRTTCTIVDTVISFLPKKARDECEECALISDCSP